MKLPRTCLTLSLALIAFVPTVSSARPPRLDDKLTILAPAAPASKVVELIGKKAGVNLWTSQATANDVILVHATDVTLQEIMDRIAAAVDGQWEKEKDGYRLVRTHKQELAEIESETSDRAVRLKLGLASSLKNLSRQTWDYATATKYVKDVVAKTKQMQEQLSSGGKVSFTFEDLTLNTPSGRALMGILASIDPHTLAQIGPGSRVVFSSTPTAVQKAMPPAVAQVLAQFLQEQRLFQRASAELGAADEKLMGLNGSGLRTLGPGNLALGVGKATMVSSGILGGPIQFNLTIVDTKGVKIGDSNWVLSPAIPDEAIAATKDETPIEFSALSKEFAGLIVSPNRPRGPVNMRLGGKNDAGKSVDVKLSVIPDGTALPRPSDALRNAILNPDKQDPMSLAPGEGVLAAAEARHENVIARLPDTAFLPIFQTVGRKTTVGSFLTSCCQSWEMRVKEEGGWLSVTPRQPVTANKNRVDRPGLGVLLRKLDGAGYLRLSDVAAYALTQAKAPTPYDLDACYMEFINPAASMKLHDFGDWAMIRFYGSLTEEQRGSLSAQTQIPLLNLTQPQVNLLSDMIFNSFDGPFVGSPTDPKAKTEDAGFNTDPETERTNVLPNGVMTNGYLDVKKKQETGIYAQNGSTGSSVFLSPEEMANVKLLSEVSEDYVHKLVGQSPKLDRFRPAEITTLDFTFMFAKNVSFHRTLRDSSAGSDATAGAYDSLSSDFRKQVEAMLADLRQAYKNMNAGSSPSKVPPPFWTAGRSH